MFLSKIELLRSSFLDLLPITYYLLSITHDLLPTTYYLSPVTYHLLLTAYYLRQNIENPRVTLYHQVVASAVVHFE